MKYFKDVKNLKELRKQYTQLLKKFHPDNGGTNEQAAEINNEYEKLFDQLKNQAADAGDDEHFETNFNKSFDESIRAAIQKIIHLEGIEIEVCGCWVWVSGDTYPVKDQLKAAGFRYSSNKKNWYFKTGEYKKHSKKVYSMDEIRSLHGSTKVETEKTLKIEA